MKFLGIIREGAGQPEMPKYGLSDHIMKYTDIMIKELGSENARKAANFFYKNMGTDFTSDKGWKKQTSS